MAGKTTGRVYLVGAGPGDPGLVTVRGMELLERADCVVYDALIPLQILGHCREGCELVDAGKRGGKHTMSQEKINALLVRKAKEYQCVVRLKGGDPLVFGRGGEEALFLRKVGVPFEIVPGVSSALAGPAYAGIPVTHRSVASQLTLVTGHGMSGRDAAAVQMDALAAAPGSKVVLMGMENLRELMDKLLQGGSSNSGSCYPVGYDSSPTLRARDGRVHRRRRGSCRRRLPGCRCHRRGGGSRRGA